MGLKRWGPLLVGSGWVCPRHSPAMYKEFCKAGGYSASMPFGMYKGSGWQLKELVPILPDSQGHQPPDSHGP
jgi:hypothetical protein